MRQAHILLFHFAVVETPDLYRKPVDSTRFVPPCWISTDTRFLQVLIHVKSLCLKCRQLELAPQRFIVRSLESGQTLLDPGQTGPANFRLRSTTIPSYFGTLKEITESSESCILCNLVLRSIQPDKNSEQSENSETMRKVELATCFLNWEVDGRKMIESQDHSPGQDEVHQSSRGRRRRIHLDGIMLLSEIPILSMQLQKLYKLLLMQIKFGTRATCS